MWLGTTGVKGGVQWWFSREAVFWLPSGAFPGWVEYVLAFPKAPRGMSEEHDEEANVRWSEYDGVWHVRYEGYCVYCDVC